MAHPRLRRVRGADRGRRGPRRLDDDDLVGDGRRGPAAPRGPRAQGDRRAARPGAGRRHRPRPPAALLRRAGRRRADGGRRARGRGQAAGRGARRRRAAPRRGPGARGGAGRAGARRAGRAAPRARPPRRRGVHRGPGRGAPPHRGRRRAARQRAGRQRPERGPRGAAARARLDGRMAARGPGPADRGLAPVGGRRGAELRRLHADPRAGPGAHPARAARAPRSDAPGRPHPRGAGGRGIAAPARSGSPRCAPR